jgi:hypothetical protein
LKPGVRSENALKNWRGNGRLLLKIWAITSTKIVQSLGDTLSKGIGNCCTKRAEVLTTRPGDAGAMPRTACVLVIGKGAGQPRQPAQQRVHPTPPLRPFWA